MRIVYFSMLLLGVNMSAMAEPSGQQTWQDIVRSTQNRKPEPTPEAEEPAAPETNTLYKVVDENGVPSFTDVAPVDEKAESFEVESKPSLNVLGDKTNERKQYERKLIQQAEYRKKQAQQQEQAIDKAKQAVEEAKKRQKEGKDPTNEEWQNTNKGRRFLKESYFERQKALEAGVKQAKERLKALQ